MGYGRERVLDGVDLEISRGAIWGLVGDNGSGKSTLLKILAGILRPERGHLRVAGSHLKIGYMPENCLWYPHLTGAQVLRYFARYSGADANIQERTLKRVGLWEARDKKVGAYSKGMKQKLGLAQAIVGAPDLLILDEPSNGLDPRGIVDFYEILQERVETGTTVVLSSHLLDELDGRISHIALLRGGRIAKSGACEDLLRQANLPCRVELRAADLSAVEKAVTGRWSLSKEDGTVLVILPDDEVLALMRVLGDAGVAGALRVRHPGLEDLYLHGFDAPFSSNGKPHAASVVKEGVGG